jgi:hypothetical protein
MFTVLFAIRGLSGNADALGASQHVEPISFLLVSLEGTQQAVSEVDERFSLLSDLSLQPAASFSLALILNPH